MTVIRTSLRKKITRSVLSAAALIGTAAGVLFLYPLVPEISALFIPVRSQTGEMTRIANMNDTAMVLFEPVEPEPEPAQITVNEAVYEQQILEPVPEITASELPGKYIRTYNRFDANEDISAFTVHSGRIVEETFTRGNGPEYIELSGGAQVRNCTDLDNSAVMNICSVMPDIAVEMYSDEPQVLILHTHTTESYEPYTKDWYDEQYTSRSSDPENGVVAVGDAIAEQLASAGISVIHDCTIHDEIYTGAYARSLSTAVSVLDMYPSVKIVLDIHRDAIEYSDGSRVSAVTEIDGKKAAQVMIICAADDGNYDVPDFYNNLHFACGLQQSMETLFPTLTRPVLFQYCQYNQQISHGALLIEVGSHGNSIDEAVYSGELIGKALAELLAVNAAKEPETIPVMAGMPLYFLERVR